MPQLRSKAFPWYAKKESWGTNNDNLPPPPPPKQQQQKKKKKKKKKKRKKRHIWNHRRTNKEELKRKNRLGMISRKITGVLNQFYSRKLQTYVRSA